MAKGKEFLTNLIIGGKVSPTLAKAINKANSQSKALEKIGAAGVAIGKATLASATAVAAGVVAISKSAVESYAEYEQLVGGSQLMFGDAYSYVAEKAATAYKDVQMSQNEYLQQVNGFATGLKTALGGNEQLAAELSHKIIKAEADVVAATGNTAENVQNAFNGIMKSNYTMLDNLQLGITPTKQGFQDLIDKVNKWNATNGKLTKYTINNLADCQSALVDYIEMQGLAGYASNEASGTIQGSLAMTKAAWSNLVTGIADENADMGTLINNFVDSASAYVANLLPKISVILDKIPSLVTGLMPMIPPAIETLLPSVISGVNQIMIGVGNALPSLIQSIVSAMGQIVSGSLETMPTPMLIIAGAIAAVTAGIKAYNAVIAIKNVLDKVQEVGIKNLVVAQIASNAAFLASPIFWIIAGIVALIAIFVVLWKKCDWFRNFWIKLWEGIKTVFFAVINWIKENWKLVILFLANPFAGLFALLWSKCEWFRNIFIGLWNGIKTVFFAVINWVKENWKLMLLFLANPFAGLFALLWSKCEWFRNIFIGIWESIKNAFFTAINFVKENWKTMLLFLVNPLAGVFKYCYEHFEGFRNMVNNIISSVINFFVNLWNKITSMFKTVAHTIANGISGTFKSVINAVIGFAEGIINTFFTNINRSISLINKIPGVNIPLIATLSIPRLATGGNFDGRHPQLAIVGDAPETMVPHGNTPRNRALLAEAAKGVGVGVGGNNVTITYAPVINGGNGADVRQALRESEADFERKMDEYFRKKGRVSFA